MLGIGTYTWPLRRTRGWRVLSTSLRVLGVFIVLILGAVIAGPLTYDGRAHQALDDASVQWSHWGNQLFGLDVTSPRQNIFSLAWDLDHTVTIVDHSRVYGSRFLALANWFQRGSMHTVGDALRWFDVSLTIRQARALNLCRSLNALAEDRPIVIQPDPWQYGIASWYGPGFDGRMTANGEIFHQDDQTAAHKTLPLGSIVRVVATRTGNSTIVRINDRGPYIAGRNIDMSRGSKKSLGMADLAAVYLERLDPTALDVSCE